MCCIIFATFTHCSHVRELGYFPCKASKARAAKGKKQFCGGWGPDVVLESDNKYCHGCLTMIHALDQHRQAIQIRQNSILKEVRAMLAEEPLLPTAPVDKGKGKDTGKGKEEEGKKGKEEEGKKSKKQQKKKQKKH